MHSVMLSEADSRRVGRVERDPPSFVCGPSGSRSTRPTLQDRTPSPGACMRKRRRGGSRHSVAVPPVFACILRSGSAQYACLPWRRTMAYRKPFAALANLHRNHRATTNRPTRIAPGYNGVWNIRTRPNRRTLFVPAVAEYELEHIFDGDKRDTDGSRKIYFETRTAPMTLKKISDAEAELHQDPTPTFHLEKLDAFQAGRAALPRLHLPLRADSARLRTRLHP